MSGFPFATLPAVEHDGALPQTADCIIIGGGVIGITAALYLARCGIRALVLEKGRVACEQSSRNWGWIRTQGRDIAEIPISLESRGLWQELETQCGGLGIRTVGVTYLAKKPADLARYEDWLGSAQGFGLDSQMMTAAQVEDLIPNAQGGWIGALHTPSDMRGEPWGAVPRIARLAVSEGVQIIENCAVRSLDMVAGKVAGVITERGRVAAPSVVLAGGAWSGLFLGNHGVRIPQLSVRATVMATETLPMVHGGAAVDDELAFRARDDGGYSLAPSTMSDLFVGPDAFRYALKYLPLVLDGGWSVRKLPFAPKGFPDAWGTKRRWRADQETPFERMRMLAPDPRPGKTEALRKQMAARFPQLGAVGLAAQWGGMIDAMPDVVPIVDHCADLPGLTVVTGMCGHGFGIGPAFGKITADLVTGADPGHDLTRFRMGRFNDGSRMIPGPNI